MAVGQSPMLITSPGNRVLTCTSSFGSYINRPVSRNAAGAAESCAGEAESRME